jgi:hypothetical protein
MMIDIFTHESYLVNNERLKKNTRIFFQIFRRSRPSKIGDKDELPNGHTG